METYKVNEYENLSNAATIVKSYLELLNNDNKEIENALNRIDDNDIFMGPTCDKLIEAWIKVKKEINTKSNILLDYSKYLNLTEFMYKEIDHINSSDISSV